MFDGEKPPYKPTDQQNPLNDYGVTKLDGEVATQAAHPEALILRVPGSVLNSLSGVLVRLTWVLSIVLYGFSDKLSESAVTVIYQAVLNPQVVAPFEHQSKCHSDSHYAEVDSV